MKQDLQTFLQQYEADHPNQVLHIQESVDRDFAVTAATLDVERMSEPPVLIFHTVADISEPVLSGMFSSRDRIAYAVGTQKDKLHKHWAEISKNLLPPLEVSEGICQNVTSWT